MSAARGGTVPKMTMQQYKARFHYHILTDKSPKAHKCSNCMGVMRERNAINQVLFICPNTRRQVNSMGLCSRYKKDAERYGLDAKQLTK